MVGFIFGVIVIYTLVISTVIRFSFKPGWDIAC
jgi:hypothetical protein